MPNRVQTLRSSLTGNRPAASTRQPGELYVNFADNQFGVINTAQTAQDLIPIRFFSTTSNYNMNDYVVNAGVLYKATAAITAGAFNPAQWTSISASVTVGDIPPANPQSGNLWFDSLGGQLYVYYNDGNSAQWVIAVTNLVAPYVPGSSEGGYVNKLRNGTFDVWQRGTSPISIAPAGATLADGWIVYPAGVAMNVAVATNSSLTGGAKPPSSIYGLWLQGAAGITGVSVQQRVESWIAAQLIGGSVPITFQAKIYNQTGASFTPTLIVGHATVQDNYAGSATDLAAVNLQSCPASQWTTVAYTFTLPLASLQLSIFCHLTITGASGASGKNIGIAEADLRVTPGLPVGLCANPPPPELRPVHEELAFCQRYFVATPIFTIGGAGAVGIDSYVPIMLPVSMRVAPTINAGGSGGSGYSSVGTTSPTTFGFSATITLTAVAFVLSYQFNASAEL